MQRNCRRCNSPFLVRKLKSGNYSQALLCCSCLITIRQELGRQYGKNTPIVLEGSRSQEWRGCMSIVDVGDQDFDARVLKSSVPVLVDFWDASCVPCRSIANILDQLVGQYEGRMKFVKVNVSACPKIVKMYEIRSIPTLLIFQKGKLIRGRVGGGSKQRIQEWIGGKEGECGSDA